MPTNDKIILTIEIDYKWDTATLKDEEGRYLAEIPQKEMLEFIDKYLGQYDAVRKLRGRLNVNKEN